jgi:hypothetical protein
VCAQVLLFIAHMIMSHICFPSGCKASAFNGLLMFASCNPPGCTVESESSLDYLMLAAGLAGLVLFYTAPALSSSLMFRLSCGSALFTAGSLLVLLILMFRCETGVFLLTVI